MNLSAVDLNLLVALDLLLDTRSVRGAAQRAGVSPSAMSHTLGRLRTLLDDELLVRAGRTMVPTARAEALHPPLRTLLAGARDLLTADEGVRPETLRRAFTLVCTDHVTTVLLPRVEALLRTEAPGVDVYVAPLHPSTMADLRAGTVHAAIGVFPEAPPEMRLRRLFEDGFVVIARPGHPRLDGEALELDTWLAEDHLLVAPRGTPTGRVDELLAERGRARRVARTVPHFLSALWLVSRSDLVLTISRRLVQATAADIAVRAWPPPIPLPDYRLDLLWHPRTDSDPEARWFRDLLVRAAATLDAESGA